MFKRISNEVSIIAHFIPTKPIHDDESRFDIFLFRLLPGIDLFRSKAEKSVMITIGWLFSFVRITIKYY